MKKFYFLVFAILISGSAIGQNAMNFPAGKSFDQKQISKIKLHQTGSTAKDNSRWYNYGEAMDLLLNGIGTFSSNYLFPDSTMQVVYTGGVLAGTWIHKLGEVFDPTALPFNDVTYYPGELALQKNSSYTLDSIQVMCFYLRGHKSPLATDTLIIEVATANYPGATGYSYFGPTSPVSINLSTDTTKFVDLQYTQATNSFGYTPHSTYKYILNAAAANDTLDNGANLFSVATNLSIPSNKNFYVSVSFKPAYTWTPNADSMTAYNRFRFLTLDENPDNFPSYTKGDWNVSYILPQDVRYNNAGGWNGSYIPSFAYMGGATNTYSYIHHSIYYKCTGVSNFGYVSVQENNAVDNILGNAYPNPVNVNNYLIIPVNTNDSKSTLVISDILGQEIMKFNLFKNGQVSVNTSELNAGLYFYTLNTGKNTITKKFSVVK
jgi:hypothetical protein